MKHLNINYVKASDLKIPEWKATHILRPDLLVLSASLMEFGFIEPIHVRASTKEVIDGSERLRLALNVSRIIDAHGDMIPVIEHDCDGLTAMMMHLQTHPWHTSKLTFQHQSLSIFFFERQCVGNTQQACRRTLAQ